MSCARRAWRRIGYGCFFLLVLANLRWLTHLHGLFGTTDDGAQASPISKTGVLAGSAQIPAGQMRGGTPESADQRRVLQDKQAAEVARKIPAQAPPGVPAVLPVKNAVLPPDRVPALPPEKPKAPPPAPPPAKETWVFHKGKSCQNYANDDSTPRDLESSKRECIRNDACEAIECPSGYTSSGCTVRALGNLVPYAPVDCYIRKDANNNDEGPKDGSKKRVKLHPEYHDLLKQYPFQAVTNQKGKEVNIILVRSAPDQRQIAMYERLKEEILFIGISSFEDFPKPSVNPYSAKYAKDKYTGMFPGFLHMMRPDDAKKWFPPHVKLLLMSQSDFQLPNHAPRDYSVPRKWDFTYSGSDQDVHNDCKGWSSFAKNWTFVQDEALEVMCGELGLTGVLVATIDKQNRKRCKIPKSCEGKILQTQYIPQDQFLHYVEQSRFLFLPQIHDASPRVSTQALANDVPLLMNAHISGGWKYLNDQTGEMFHDMTDFREAARKIVKNADVRDHYKPREWIREHYGNAVQGERLFKFIRDEFPEWAGNILPTGTTKLLI